jgi:hypothetical protein
MVGIGPVRPVCETKHFAVSCFYIYSLIMFVFDNLGNFKTNSSLHDLILGTKINYIFHQ